MSWSFNFFHSHRKFDRKEEINHWYRIIEQVSVNVDHRLRKQEQLSMIAVAGNCDPIHWMTHRDWVKFDRSVTIWVRFAFLSLFLWQCQNEALSDMMRTVLLSVFEKGKCLSSMCFWQPPSASRCFSSMSSYHLLFIITRIESKHRLIMSTVIHF